MNHNYTSCYFDGEYYNYLCTCGHEVKTTDGRLPIKMEIIG